MVARAVAVALVVGSYSDNSGGNKMINSKGDDGNSDAVIAAIATAIAIAISATDAIAVE